MKRIATCLLTLALLAGTTFLRAWLAAGLLLYLPAHVQMSVMVNEEVLVALRVALCVWLLALRPGAPAAVGVAGHAVIRVVSAVARADMKRRADEGDARRLPPRVHGPPARPEGWTQYRFLQYARSRRRKYLRSRPQASERRFQTIS